MKSTQNSIRHRCNSILYYKITNLSTPKGVYNMYDENISRKTSTNLGGRNMYDVENNIENNENTEEKEKLPFAKNEVVKLMKKNLDSDKMIKERVKVEMNKFLYEILVNVCKELNEYPYTTIDYEMLKECIYPYTNIKRINHEKEMILKHLDAIKADCDALSMDVQKTLKSKDTFEEELITEF